MALPYEIAVHPNALDIGFDGVAVLTPPAELHNGERMPVYVRATDVFKWQPIETAPKYKPLLVSLQNKKTGRQTVSILMLSAPNGAIEWRTASYRPVAKNWVPTHWMRMPFNPFIEAGKGVHENGL